MATLAEILDNAAREAIREALRASSGNVRQASAALDISYAKAHREIERLGLRAWLTESYDRTDRQPAKNNRSA